MTNIYFVRHAQPDDGWKDDRTRPLTPMGLKDRLEVSGLLSGVDIALFISSPYKRSIDTIADCASFFNMEIKTDERFKERRQGISNHAEGILEKRWSNFDFCEEGGENLRSVQRRNIEAVKEILDKCKDKRIVVGTHGTALSTIMNYYDSSLGCNWFKKIWFCMPCVIRLDFDGQRLIGREELLSIERGY